MRKVIYTCVTNSYDQLFKKKEIPGWETIYFTDNPFLKDAVFIPSEPKLERKIKIMPWKYFKFDVCIWIDGNIDFDTLDVEAIEAMDKDFIVMDHPHRKNVYEEAEACKRLKKDDPDLIDKQMRLYRDVGFDSEQLYATGFIFRRNTIRTREMSQLWLNEVMALSRRDQLSLPFAMRKYSKETLRFGTIHFMHGLKFINKHTPIIMSEETKTLTHTEILNMLIEKNGYKRYLEIGVQNPDHNYNLIRCQFTCGVDPEPVKDAVALFHVTSDVFFREIIPAFPNKVFYDLVFVDGLHEHEQVKRDIQNSLELLNDGGMIVVHDCLPTSEDMQAVPRVARQWTGDVWRAMIHFRQVPDLYVVTVDTDFGVGIIMKGKKAIAPNKQMPFVNENISYQEFDSNREAILNIISPEKFLAYVKA